MHRARPARHCRKYALVGLSGHLTQFSCSTTPAKRPRQREHFDRRTTLPLSSRSPLATIAGVIVGPGGCLFRARELKHEGDADRFEPAGGGTEDGRKLCCVHDPGGDDGRLGPPVEGGAAPGDAAPGRADAAGLDTPCLNARVPQQAPEAADERARWGGGTAAAVAATSATDSGTATSKCPYR